MTEVWVFQTLQTLYEVVMTVVLLGMAIFVHELGHFIAARKCGMVVEVFSMGFGSAIWKWKRNGIVYKIGWIPIGGYVALPQLDPSGMALVQGGEGKDGEPQVKLPPIAPWKKIIVSLAGGVGNMLLAVAIAWVVYWRGMPVNAVYQTAEVGFVHEKSKAHEAGLKAGDTILSVNGRAVKTWSDVMNECMMTETARLEVAASGPAHETRTVLVTTDLVNRDLRKLRHMDGVEPRSLGLVGRVMKGSGAEAAGIQAGDVIQKLCGEQIRSRAQVNVLVTASGGAPLPVVVERNGEQLEFRVTPQREDGRKDAPWRIGVEFDVIVIHPGPWRQIADHATLIVRVLRKLVSPREARETADKVGALPVIVKQYMYLVQQSIMEALWFTGLLCVNLAILNLLPIPVLDGGHIVFSLWEAVTRKPVNARVANALVNVFAVLLIGLLLMLCVRDILWYTSAGRLVDKVLSRGDQTNAPAAASSADPSPAAARGTNSTPDQPPAGLPAHSAPVVPAEVPASVLSTNATQ